MLKQLVNNKVIHSLLLLGSFSLLSNGCGFWTNFKTYFNTYYNANKIFNKAEEDLLKNQLELFYFVEKPTPNNLHKDFEAVIEKTSAILQYSKESGYVDEALLLTGKSFYYQQNYSRALRKFNELATREDSELRLENQLWTAKSYLQLREFDKALKLLNDVKEEAKVEGEEEILIQTYNSLIGYLIYIEDYESAVNEINEYLDTEIDDELRAEVLFEMGRMYKLIEDYDKAADAFLRVGDYSPTFEIDFSSKFESAKLKGILGDVDTSLILLQDLRDEDKFSDSWGAIDLEIGKIFYDRNEIEEALDKFTEVDTTYPKTEAASISGFYRAEILENQYHDYDSALVFYSVAAKSIAPQSIKDAAQKKSQSLNQYLGYHETLTDLATQYLYLTDENAFIEDSLEVLELIRQDSIKSSEQKRESNSLQERGGGRRNQTKSKYVMPERPKIPIDSIKVLNSKNYFQLANLLFSEFDDADSAYYYYQKSLDEKPNNPNEAQTYYAIGNYFLIKKDKQKADSMFTLVYDKFEFDPIRNEAAKQIGKPLYDFDKDPVEEEYVEAEKILDTNKFKSAISKLFKIYKKNPKSIYASKSLYTIGYILENELDMPDSAASVYDTLNSKYATSIYSKAILKKLSAYKQEKLKESISQDTSAVTAKPVKEIVEKEKTIVREQPKTNQNVIDENSEPQLPPQMGKKESPPIIEEKKEIQKSDLTEMDSIELVSDDIQIVGRDIYKEGSDYYVQVSSWKSEETANSEVEKLTKMNYNAFILKIFVEEKNSIYNRVRVGPFKSFNEATNVRKKLNNY